MLKICVILFIFLGSFRVSLFNRDYEITLEKLETLKGKDEPLVEYVLRASRSKQGDTNYIINGYMIYREDLGVDVQHSVSTAYSADGSSQFRLHPYKIQSSNICQFFKGHYRKYGQSWIKEFTDFPYIPVEGICPLPRGMFYVKNLTLGKVQLPNHAPRGVWKMEQKFERNGKVIGGLLMYAKITDKV